MLKSFSIDFIRQIFEQKLLEEHIKDVNFYGGKEQVNIFSFYEQLKSQEQVDRFVENYRDLADQQNRSGLILNGVIVAPENPTITNLYSSLIIPMSFTCSMRCLIGNRDQAIWTINNLINKLKGRKVDIAQLNCVDEDGKSYCEPFVVGTIGHNDNEPTLKNGDYIGELENAAQLEAKLIERYQEKGVIISTSNYSWLYCENNGLLKVVAIENGDTDTAHFLEDDGTHNDIIFPPEHTSFEKYKCSLSFDAIRCDEPRNLNANEYCELSFGGSATLVNESVQLGNDLIKIGIQKLKIPTENNDIDFTTLPNNPTWWLEPLEMPSGLNANTNPIQLASNMFKTNSHTDAVALSLQYTFICDKSIPLLKQLFKYGRYGTQGLTVDDISPNMIFGIKEIWSSWGDYDPQDVKAKLVENVDIENTESDTLTLMLSLQIQGENE